MHSYSEHLDVSYNSIGDVGVASLAQSLKHLHHVNVLDLALTKIGDDGAISLAKVFEYCN